MSAKPIAVVVSDTHGAPMAWARHPELAGDSYFAMEQICEYCVSHSLPLILAGDVLDKPYPDPYTVNVFVGHLTSLRWRGISVMFIQGQHEYSHTKPWLSLVPGAWHVNRQWFFLPSPSDRPRVKFYGLDFTRSAELPAALAEIPHDTDVLIAHQVWEEHMGRKASCEGALNDVPHVKLVITGDYHGHKVTEMTARDGRPLRVASPGSTCLQALDEDPAKYFFVLYDDLSLRSVALECRRLARYQVRTQPQLNDLVAEELPMIGPDWGVLPETIARPIVHVKYNDDLPEAVSRIQAAAGDRCHLFLTPFRVEKEEAAAGPVADEPHGLEWHLRQFREEDPSVYAMALRLWRAADLRAEAAAAVAEALQVNEDIETRGLWAATQENDRANPDLPRDRAGD